VAVVHLPDPLGLLAALALGAVLGGLAIRRAAQARTR